MIDEMIETIAAFEYADPDDNCHKRYIGQRSPVKSASMHVDRDLRDLCDFWDEAERIIDRAISTSMASKRTASKLLHIEKMKRRVVDVPKEEQDRIDKFANEQSYQWSEGDREEIAFLNKVFDLE